MTNPSRFTLLSLYVDIFKKLKSMGVNPKEIVITRQRKIIMNETGLEEVKKMISSFSFEEQVYLRTLNDQQRYSLGDDLMHIGLLLNELLPRFKDLEAKERQSYKEVEKLPPKTVISPEDLVYNHLRFEDPAYIRRLITTTVLSADYYMKHSQLSEETVEQMEFISAEWLLKDTKIDQEILKILSMVDSSGKSAELQGTDEPRYKYVRELMPSLIALSSFKRSEQTQFAKFVFILPSVLTWALGNYSSNMVPADEDPLMDVLEATMTFTRSLQANADKAARIRQMFHHGFPVYKELLDLVRSQSQLMSWSLESIIYRLANNLKALLENRENSEPMVRFLLSTGILTTYAKHKDTYIERL